MSQCFFTTQAQQDLDEIANYLAHYNAATALRVLQEIEQACRRLVRHPGLGRRREELAVGVKSYPVKRYVIFYREAQGGIEVLRVLHSARDIPSLFDTNKGDE